MVTLRPCSVVVESGPYDVEDQQEERSQRRRKIGVVISVSVGKFDNPVSSTGR